mmetsp:Transcript_3489/g.4969  ORF Transcript_3489/g.4969 Transcript_3489/m.4969 type:complete len:220 (+) Transcript_3489:629-1288(+)
MKKSRKPLSLPLSWRMMYKDILNIKVLLWTINRKHSLLRANGCKYFRSNSLLTILFTTKRSLPLPSVIRQVHRLQAILLATKLIPPTITKEVHSMLTVLLSINLILPGTIKEVNSLLAILLTTNLNLPTIIREVHSLVVLLSTKLNLPTITKEVCHLLAVLLSTNLDRLTTIKKVQSLLAVLLTTNLSLPTMDEETHGASLLRRIMNHSNLFRATCPKE